jgi:xylan 1,4-beta-xylosidase
MTAEGGTGFGHGISLARSLTIEGPYEPDPGSPFITSWPRDYYGRNNRDFLRPQFFNPEADLQKAGHGSVVETPNGEWYVAHLSSRPLASSRRSVLGRETSIQKVRWLDGWLRLVDGGVLAQSSTPALDGRAVPIGVGEGLDVRDDFDGPQLDLHLSSIRRTPNDVGVSLSARAGHLRIPGGDSLFSLFDVSLIATRLRTFRAHASTRLEFAPTHFSHMAGLVVYYDNRNWLYLRVYLSESLGGRAIGIMRAHDGHKEELRLNRQLIPEGPIDLGVAISEGTAQFSWGQAGDVQEIGPSIDISYLSDESARGFTGTFVGITAQDAMAKDSYADFDYFELLAAPDKGKTA